MCVLFSSVLCYCEGVLKSILFRFFKQVFVWLVVGVYMFVHVVFFVTVKVCGYLFFTGFASVCVFHGVLELYIYRLILRNTYRCVSPWYNRTGWLGVKHQLTYLPWSGVCVPAGMCVHSCTSVLDEMQITKAQNSSMNMLVAPHCSDLAQ